MKGKNFSGNNQGQRKKSDFYETPYSITQQLLDTVKLRGSILEPACGDGAIVKVLQDNGYAVKAYDQDVDFLKEESKFDTVITNPPFSLAQEFIQKAKQVAQVGFYFLLPLSYLHGKERYDTIYTDETYGLKSIFVFTRYPMLGDALREDGKYRTGMMVYAWYYFENGYKGKPEINWLDNHKYVIGAR